MTQAAQSADGDGLLRFADELHRMAPPPEAQVAAPELHLVTFALDREEFGVPIGQVREVIRAGEITRVPQARRHVRGVTNLRGRVLAVMELRSRLGLPAATITPHSRIIVVDVQDRTLGVLVDRVSQVVKVPTTTVAPAPEDVLTPETDYITGVARYDTRLIVLLDMQKVLLFSD